MKYFFFYFKSSKYEKLIIFIYWLSHGTYLICFINKFFSYYVRTVLPMHALFHLRENISIRRKSYVECTINDYSIKINNNKKSPTSVQIMHFFVIKIIEMSIICMELLNPKLLHNSFLIFKHSDGTKIKRKKTLNEQFFCF